MRRAGIVFVHYLRTSGRGRLACTLLTLLLTGAAPGTLPAQTPDAPAAARRALEESRRKARDLLARARTEIAAGKAEAALASLRAALPAVEYDEELGPEVAALLGEREFLAGHWMEAAQAFELAARWLKHPGAAAAHVRVADAYEKAHRPEDAARALSVGAERHWRTRGAPSMRLRSGQLYLSLLDADAAAAEFRQILRLYPASPEAPAAQTGLAEVALLHNDPVSAQAGLAAVPVLFPGSPHVGQAFYLLAWLARLQGDFQAAEAQLKQIGPQAPPGVRARSALLSAELKAEPPPAGEMDAALRTAGNLGAARALIMTGRPGEALKLLDREPPTALDQGLRNLHQITRSWALAESGSLKEAQAALDHLKDSLSLREQAPNGLVRALVELRSGRPAEAAAVARALLGRNLYLDEHMEAEILLALAESSPEGLSSRIEILEQWPGLSVAPAAARLLAEHYARTKNAPGAARIASILNERILLPYRRPATQLKELLASISPQNAAQAARKTEELAAQPGWNELYPEYRSGLLQIAGSPEGAARLTLYLRELGRGPVTAASRGLLGAAAAASAAAGAREAAIDVLVQAAARAEAASTKQRLLLDAAGLAPTPEARAKVLKSGEWEPVDAPEPEVIDRLIALGEERLAFRMARGELGEKRALLALRRGEPGAAKPASGDAAALLAMAEAARSSGRYRLAVESYLEAARFLSRPEEQAAALLAAGFLEYDRTRGAVTKKPLEEFSRRAGVPLQLRQKAAILLAALMLMQKEDPQAAGPLPDEAPAGDPDFAALGAALRARRLLQAGDAPGALALLKRSPASPEPAPDRAAELLAIRRLALLKMGEEDPAEAAGKELMANYPATLWAAEAREERDE